MDTENKETPVIGAAVPAPLIFTDAAAQRVGELIQEEDNPDLMLRVFVAGGGCSGFQYGFTFDEMQEDGDSRVENHGVTLIVDPMSVQYLMGAEIDYKEDLEGARFIIRNPNATTTCGCGSSFTV
jgi:iron-sulfur cluster insertion protein